MSAAETYGKIIMNHSLWNLNILLYPNDGAEFHLKQQKDHRGGQTDGQTNNASHRAEMWKSARSVKSIQQNSVGRQLTVLFISLSHH